MKCMNSHDNPEDARFCQECGVSLQQQSAEEQAQEALQRLHAKQEEPVRVQTGEEGEQNALREKWTQPVDGSDVSQFLGKFSPKQWGIAGGAALAIVVAIAVGVNASGGDVHRVMTVGQLEGSLKDNNTVSDGTTVTMATCQEKDVNKNGSGTYTCDEAYSDGTQENSRILAVDNTGHWVKDNDSGTTNAPPSPDITPVMTASQLEYQMEGTTASDGTTLFSANCTEGNVNADGSGPYDCTSTFSDDVTVTDQIIVSSDGAYSPRF
jgi:hypothetical protein